MATLLLLLVGCALLAIVLRLAFEIRAHLHLFRQNDPIPCFECHVHDGPTALYTYRNAFQGETTASLCDRCARWFHATPSVWE